MAFYQDLQWRRRDLIVRSTGTRIPLTWSFLKSLARQFGLFLFVCLVFALRRCQPTRRTYTIGFYPAAPEPWYKIWYIARYMGARFSEDIRRCDALFYFEDKTQARLNTDFIGMPHKVALNAYCTDIGKDRVARVFEEVFGYGLAVDPVTYHGPVVCKSVENAAHDGTILYCPVTEQREGMVYQRLVDNAYDGTHVQDLRVAVVGASIPLVYLKERSIDERFANTNTRARLKETSEVLSDREVTLILRFCRRMGLDFGGLDVLRDRASGQIFIVDVNKTCMGPPIPLTFGEKVEALDRLGKALIALIEENRA